MARQKEKFRAPGLCSRPHYATLHFKDQNLDIQVPIAMCPIKEETVGGDPIIVIRGPTGKLARQRMVDRVTGEILEGYFRRWFENSTEISSKDLQHFQEIDGKEVEVDPYEPTIGRGRILEVKTEIPDRDIEEYLSAGKYAIFPTSEASLGQLWTLAQDMDSEKQCWIAPIIFRRGFKKSFGIGCAHTDGNKFAITMTVTQSRINRRYFTVPKKEVLREIKMAKELF